MKTKNHRTLNFIRLLIGSLLVLSVASFASAQKRTKRKTTPAKQQFQSVTVEGATFKIPVDWKKNTFLETLWGNRKDSSVNISIRYLTAEDIVKAGGYTIEQDLEMFYEGQRRGGTEDVRYLEIDDVKGVHFLNDYEGNDQNFEALTKKSVFWVYERMYKGQRQLGNISFSVPAKDFPKKKAEIYQMLQAIKFAKD